MPMLAWPSRSETILGWTPCMSSRVAWAWRRSWKRSFGSPRCRRKRAQPVESVSGLSEAPLVLALPLRVQVAVEEGGQDDGAARAPRLGFLEHKPGLGRLQAAHHACLPALGAEIRPAQGEQFAAAHPGRERERAGQLVRC